MTRKGYFIDGWWYPAEDCVVKDGVAVALKQGVTPKGKPAGPAATKQTAPPASKPASKPAVKPVGPGKDKGTPAAK